MQGPSRIGCILAKNCFWPDFFRSIDHSRVNCFGLPLKTPIIHPVGRQSSIIFWISRLIFSKFRIFCKSGLLLEAKNDQKDNFNKEIHLNLTSIYLEEFFYQFGDPVGILNRKYSCFPEILPIFEKIREKIMALVKIMFLFRKRLKMKSKNMKLWGIM